MYLECTCLLTARQLTNLIDARLGLIFIKFLDTKITQIPTEVAKFENYISLVEFLEVYSKVRQEGSDPL